MYTLPRQYIAPSHLTIIVTTYPPHYHLLQLALASIDYAHTDVIVVNDSDTKLDIIGDNITVINRDTPEKWGAGTARNKGWRRAKTDLVLFLDGDDILFPHAVENMHWYYKKMLAETNEDHIIYGNLIRTDMATVKVTLPQYRGTDIKLSPINVENSRMPYLCLIPVKHLIATNGYPDENEAFTWEEIMWEQDIWMRGIPATHMDIITYIYRWSNTGRRALSEPDEVKTAVQQQMYNRYYEFIKNGGNDMCGGGCGGSPVQVLKSRPVVSNPKLPEPAPDENLYLIYNDIPVTSTLKGPVTGLSYRWGHLSRIKEKLVVEKDVQWIDVNKEIHLEDAKALIQLEKRTGPVFRYRLEVVPDKPQPVVIPKPKRKQPVAPKVEIPVDTSNAVATPESVEALLQGLITPAPQVSHVSTFTVKTLQDMLNREEVTTQTAETWLDQEKEAEKPRVTIMRDLTKYIETHISDPTD